MKIDHNILNQPASPPLAIYPTIMYGYDQQQQQNVKNAHSSTICKSQKLKAIQIPINNRTDKLQYIHTIEY